MSCGCWYVGHIIKPGKRIPVFDRGARLRRIVRRLAEDGLKPRAIGRVLGKSPSLTASICAKSWIKSNYNLHMLEKFHKP
jgi:hypothetical protein